MDTLSKTDCILRNITNELVATSNVNIYNVKDCGEIIITDMVGKSPLTYSFQKIWQAVKLSLKALGVVIDSELLFQRWLVSVCNDDEIQSAFKLELTHYPASFLTDYSFMRSSNKVMLCKLMDTYKFD